MSDSGSGDERLFLKESRRRLAEFWLNAPAGGLPRLYAGDAGRMQRLLASAAVRYEWLDADEEAFAQSLVEKARAGVSDAESSGATLAGMLYSRAHRIDPPPPIDLPRVQPWLIKDYLAWLIAPVAFFTDVGESSRYANHLANVLETVSRGVVGAKRGDPFWTNVGMLVAQRLDCTPAYANDLNLKALQQARGQILDWSARLMGLPLEHSFVAPSSGRRRRMGIVARHLRPSAETFALLPVYEHLREHCDVVLYVCEPPGEGLGKYCVSRVNAAKLLPPDPMNRRRMILADDLDVLFYGTNLTTASHDLVLLAQHRLARVQVTGVANVVTTGLGTIDYFLSGTTSDPAGDAAEHYTEKLFRLEGSAHCFGYGPDAGGKAKAMTRAELGLGDDQLVFVSGANLYKLVPELLGVWARILADVPNAVLMLFPFGPNWYPSYPSEAFELHAGSVMGAERVKILQPQPAPDRHQLREYFRVADVYLDSFPFCGSTSLIEPLEAGLPIVTRGGSTFRSAMGSGVLREMGLEELVAGSEERYAAIAIELARDAGKRKAIGDHIRQRMNGSSKPTFLDSAGYARRVAAAFEAMLASRV